MSDLGYLKPDTTKNNTVEAWNVDEQEFNKKLDSIYEKLMPIDAGEDLENWKVGKTTEVAEVLLKELSNEEVALIFSRAVHMDIRKRMKVVALRQAFAGNELGSVLDKLSGSLKEKLGLSSEEKQEEKPKEEEGKSLADLANEID